MKKTFFILITLGMFIIGFQGTLIPNGHIVAVASKGNINQMEDVTIRHIVLGNKILVECIAPSISFSSRNNAMLPGKIIVSVDGKIEGEYNTAAFVIKDVSKGTHQVKVDIVKPTDESYGVSKEFTVTIK